MNWVEGGEQGVAMVEAAVTEGLDQADAHRKQWIRVMGWGGRIGKGSQAEERCGLECSTVLV